MERIPLNKGKFALIDDDDFLALSKYRWICTKIGNKEYGQRSSGHNTKLMHRVIMNAPKGMQIDHIDGDGLNNQKNNLRLCTQSENLRNRKNDKRNSTGIKGVYRVANYPKYRVQICLNNKAIFLGYFSDLEEARKTYAKAAKKYHGEFANLLTH